MFLASDKYWLEATSRHCYLLRTTSRASSIMPRKQHPREHLSRKRAEGRWPQSTYQALKNRSYGRFFDLPPPQWIPQELSTAMHAVSLSRDFAFVRTTNANRREWRSQSAHSSRGRSIPYSSEVCSHLFPRTDIKLCIRACA
jgi:hypothetical protein